MILTIHWRPGNLFTHSNLMRKPMVKNNFCISLQHMPYLLKPGAVYCERWEVCIESCCDNGSCGLLFWQPSLSTKLRSDNVWMLLHCLSWCLCVVAALLAFCSASFTAFQRVWYSRWRCWARALVRDVQDILFLKSWWYHEYGRVKGPSLLRRISRRHAKLSPFRDCALWFC